MAVSVLSVKRLERPCPFNTSQVNSPRVLSKHSSYSQDLNIVMKYLFSTAWKFKWDLVKNLNPLWVRYDAIWALNTRVSKQYRIIAILIAFYIANPAQNHIDIFLFSIGFTSFHGFIIWGIFCLAPKFLPHFISKKVDLKL